MLDKKKLFIFGGIVATVTTFVLKLLSTWLSKIPGLEVNLQSISITGTGLGNVLNIGLGTYAKKLFTFTNIGLPEMVYAFIGGGVAVIIGAIAVDWMRKQKFTSFVNALTKTKVGEIATVFVIAGLLVGWILAGSISIPTMSGAIILAIDALVLSWIIVMLDTKKMIVP